MVLALLKQLLCPDDSQPADAFLRKRVGLEQREPMLQAVPAFIDSEEYPNAQAQLRKFMLERRILV